MTAACLIALLVALTDAPLIIRLPVGLVAVLALPGYSLSMALFPPGALDSAERSAIAFSLSLGIIVVGAPLLGFSGVLLAPQTIVLAITAVTLVATVAAALRRRVRHAPDRLTERPTAGLGVPAGVTRAALVAAGAVAVVILALVGVSVLRQPLPATEFFILGPDGTVDSLPARVAPGTRLSLTVGIANAASPADAYRVVAESGATRLAELGPIALAPGGSWTDRLEFTVPASALGEIRILLFRGSETEPYRALRLNLEAAPTAWRALVPA